MTDDFMPYIEEPEAPKRKAVSNEDRAEFFRQGYWVTKTNQKIHVSEMDTSHIINVLKHVYVSCIRIANQNAQEAAKYAGSIIAAAYRGELSEDDLDFTDPKDHWEAHPFVDHALRILKVRDVNYELPFDDDIPF